MPRASASDLLRQPESRQQRRKLRLTLRHDPPLPVQADDLRRPGEGAEHEHDASILLQVGHRLHTAADEVDVGDRARAKDAERARPPLGERLTWPSGPFGAVATKKSGCLPSQRWSERSIAS